MTRKKDTILKRKALMIEEYKNEAGKESQKKRKRNTTKVPTLLVLLGYHRLNIFCTKWKVKKCLSGCASPYELGAVCKQCKPKHAYISAYNAY